MLESPDVQQAASLCITVRQACAEGVVGNDGMRTIKSAVHREETQIPDVLCFLVFLNVTLLFVTKIIIIATSPVFVI